MRCGVIACNYFDDYPIIELSTLGNNTDGTLRAIAKLLGVTVAEDKDASFSDKTDLLGVTLDLSDDIMGEVRVCNKPDRKKDLSQALDNIITSGKINPLEIPTLFGRLQFAESQILGRAGGLAMKTLRKLEALRCKSVDISDEQKLMFSFLKSRLNHSRPRSISTKPYSPPALVFTDGAYEPSGDSEDTVGVASIGGVIYYRENSSVKCRAFGSGAQFAKDHTSLISPEASKKHGAKLRGQAVSYCRRHQDEFVGFFCDDDDSEDADLRAQASFLEWLEAMNQPRTWVDGLCLKALSAQTGTILIIWKWTKDHWVRTTLAPSFNNGWAQSG